MALELGMQHWEHGIKFEKNDKLGLTFTFLQTGQIILRTPIGKTLKVFLSETRRPRPLIHVFGM